MEAGILGIVPTFYALCTFGAQAFSETTFLDDLALGPVLSPVFHALFKMIAFFQDWGPSSPVAATFKREGKRGGTYGTHLPTS